MSLTPRSEEPVDGALRVAFGAQHPTALRVIEQRNGFESQVALAPEIEQPAPAQRIRTSARYESLGLIAEGGLGEVLRGQDRDLGREVALKFLRAPYRDQPAIVWRFVEEAQIGGQLQHPGILPIYEIGLGADERPFIAMKLVRGQTLATLLGSRKNPSQDRRRFLGIFEQICQAIAYVHARGVVHRDLKPGNVMVGAFGEVQVMDFGFAKVLHQPSTAPDELEVATVRSEPGGHGSVLGSVFGTPAYMPPEQALGRIDEIDERADVFALGAILLEVLTGSPPYSEGDMFEQAEEAKLAPALARLAASDAEHDVVQLARDCLAAARDARPRSAREVAERVTRFLTGVEERARESALAAERARVELAGMRRARNLQLGLVAAIVSILGLVGGGYWWLARERAQGQIQQSQAAMREAESLATTAQNERDTGKATKSWDLALVAANKIESALDNEGFDAAIHSDLGARASDVKRRAQDDVLQRTLDRLALPADVCLDAVVGGSWDAEAKDREYDAAFSTYGTHPMTAPDEFVARVAAFPARAAVALDDWARHRRSLALRNKTSGVSAKLLLDVARRLDPDPARARLRDALGQDPIDSAALARLASEFELDLVKESPDTILELGSALYEAGDVGKTRSIELLGARAHPGSFLLNYLAALAQMYVRHPQWLEVRRLLDVAIALRPEYSSAHYYAGIACSRLGLLEDAEAHYVVGAAIQPPEPSFVLLRARMHVENQLEDRALEAFTGLCQLEVSARVHPVYPAWGWFESGRVLELRHDLAGALDCYRQARQILASPAFAARLAPGIGIPNAAGYAQAAEELLARIPDLMPIVDGERLPSSPEEQVEAARAALHAGRSVTGARLLRAAVEAEPKLLKSVSPQVALLGAEIAVTAGCSGDAEAQSLSEAERRQWRQQGYQWLHGAYLALLKERMPDRQKMREENAWVVDSWLCCLRLWAVRAESRLRSLPVDEARAWRGLWEDVETMFQAGQ